MKGNLSSIDSLRANLLAIEQTVDRMRCEVENLADAKVKAWRCQSKLLLEDLAVAEERQKEKPSEVLQALCAAVTYLLWREVEREAKE